MKKIQQCFDSLSNKHPHYYTIIMWLIVTLIGWLVSWIFYMIIKNIIDIINAVLQFSTYLTDIIYQSIGRWDGLYQYLILSSSVILGIWIGILFLPIMIRRVQKNQNNDEIQRRNKWIRIIIFEAVLIGYILLVSIILLYKYNVTVFFEQSLNIVTPYISEHETQLMRSDFSQIESRNDFSKIVLRMEGIAEKNKLRLPKVYNSFILPL